MLALIALQTLSQALDAELNVPGARGSLVGVVVRHGDSEAYARNESTRMVPASNQKLLTAVYALKRLGPEHRFSVKIWKEKVGAWVQTDGHPTLSFADLANAKEKLALQPGPIRLKSAYHPRVPPSWELDDLPNKYAAKPSSFTVDRGSFELWSDGGRISFKPTAYGVQLEKSGDGKVKVVFDLFSSRAKVSGTLPPGKVRLDTLALPDPEEAAARVLGGKVVRVESMPKRPCDLTLRSQPLVAILGECLQKSDNNLAENLLLAAAVSEGPVEGDLYESSAKRFATFLEREVGIEPGDVRPIDGSGMSRHNLVTPRGMAMVLDYAWRTWGSQWTTLLASPGVGTLKNRLAGTSFVGKTGTLNSVQCLSGYLMKNPDKPQVVVLVFNQTIAPSSEIQAIQDSIVRKIELIADGTVFDAYDHREGRHTHPSNLAPHWNRNH